MISPAKITVQLASYTSKIMYNCKELGSAGYLEIS